MVIGTVPTLAEELGAAVRAGDPTTTEPTDPPTPPAARAGPPVPGVLVITLGVIMVFSVVIVFLGLFAFGLSGLQEQRSQHLLYAQFRGLLDPSSPTAPSIGGVIPVGTPVALMNSPRAGIDNAVVVEGTSSGTLLEGPGHLRNSPLPGQAGESIVMGKGMTAGAPFGGITRLRKGDVITVRTGEGKFRFKVRGQLTPGQRPPAIRSDSGVLTLVSSGGAGPLGHLAPGHLVYVEAILEGKTVAAPKGRPKTVSTVEIQGHSDPGAWPFVGLWLVALLAVTAVCWRMWSRWGILQTWIVGAPVLFGILWGLSNEAMRLFPNVY
jgi:sortase A